MIILTILTFGLIWLKWKKISNQHQKDTLFQIHNIPFKIETLINALPKDNIESFESKHYRINIFIRDARKVNVEVIKKLKGVSGIFLKSNSISITFGEYTSAVAAELAKLK
ncbi:PTS system IIB component (Glc family) [Mycoplasmopsis mustelae]|uniref:PTS system IIB component (Glc family) n=1 Tax=Mycoplasmopsis mustelae TaxID=171289 RepID=A0A4R7UBY2_9BACT|nr:PTS glucose transporter subunit IIB [Mycoplasmopsis mustelae]TDV23050.1 PTS system IIB component (Glc family) [Mycoplasmopsis mustelae]